MTNSRHASLHRPGEGRWIAGVALGLAQRLQIQPWIARMIFLVLVPLGGVGIFLYAAGWILIPDEGETESIAKGWSGKGSARRWVGVTLIGLAAVVLLAETRLVRGELIFALILLGIGVLLYRGDLSAPERQSPDAANVPQAVPADQVEEPEAGPSSRPVGKPPAPPRDRSYLGRLMFGVALMSLGILGFLDAVVPGFDPSVRHYMALLVAIVGLGLVVGAWFGRAGGLVAMGIVLVPVVLVTLASDTVEFSTSDNGPVVLVSLASDTVEFSTSGDGYHRPAGVDEIPDAYRLGIGSLVVDLREVDFTGRVVGVRAEVGIGELTVYLPQDVASDVSGRVGVGSIRTWDHLRATSRQGIGLAADYASEGADGMIILDASMGLGEIEVRTLPRTTEPSTETVTVEDGQ
ncbi:MAG: PspC domain-containing protein [bacterium]|nr:PspC domain-containing protein [bacterium]